MKKPSRITVAIDFLCPIHHILKPYKKKCKILIKSQIYSVYQDKEKMCSLCIICTYTHIYMNTFKILIYIFYMFILRFVKIPSVGQTDIVHLSGILVVTSWGPGDQG